MCVSNLLGSLVISESIFESESEPTVASVEWTRRPHSQTIGQIDRPDDNVKLWQFEAKVSWLVRQVSDPQVAQYVESFVHEPENTEEQNVA